METELWKEDLNVSIVLQLLRYVGENLKDTVRATFHLLQTFKNK